jgi:exosortase
VTLSSTRRQAFLPLLILTLIALWWLAIGQLKTEWTINPQYSHGWLVPLLAVYLFWRRWQDRPEPSPSSSRRRRWLLLGPSLVIAVTLLPMRIIEEANPDWRLIDWILTAAAAALTLLGFAWSGGRPWVRHFAFPVLFIFCAVPWPTSLENSIVQNLMRLVAGLSVEGLNWIGVPALQLGNMIETDVGVISISEACSGLRTVQATLMAALLFGELDRLSVLYRVLLVPTGFLLAFLCNFLRALFLVALVIHDGPGILTKWHDPVGYMEMFVCLFALYGVSVWFCSLNRAEPVARAQLSRPPWLPPDYILGGSIAWIVLVEIATQGWFAWHEQGLVNRDRWAVRWPVSHVAYREIPITENAAIMLRFNEGHAAGWTESGNREFAIFFFRWKPGRAAAQLARSHNPEICLPASGRVLEKDLGVKILTAGKFRLPFHGYIFSDHNTPIYVFYCSWEDKVQSSPAGELVEDWSVRSRLGAAWAGHRHLGQQVLEVLLSGMPDADAAERDLENLLSEAVQPVGS